MNKKGNHWRYFRAAAIAIAAVIFLLVITGGGSGILLGMGKAASCVDSLMAAARQGDMEQVSGYLYGNVIVKGQEEVTPLDALRQAYLESITCTTGKFYTQDDALLVDVQVTHLDLASCCDQYEIALQQALNARGDDIDDSPEVFEAVTAEAMAKIRLDSVPTATEDLSLRLVNVDGQWLCVPTAKLIDLLCGNY